MQCAQSRSTQRWATLAAATTLAASGAPTALAGDAMGEAVANGIVLYILAPVACVLGLVALALIWLIRRTRHGAKQTLFDGVLGALFAVGGVAFIVFLAYLDAPFAKTRSQDQRHDTERVAYLAEVARLQPLIAREVVPAMDADIDQALNAFRQGDGAAAWRAFEACADHLSKSPAGRALDEKKPERLSREDDAAMGTRTMPSPTGDTPAREIRRDALCLVTRAGGWAEDRDAVWEIIGDYIAAHRARGFLEQTYRRSTPLQTGDAIPKAVRYGGDWALLADVVAHGADFNAVMTHYTKIPPHTHATGEAFLRIAATINAHWPANRPRDELHQLIASYQSNAGPYSADLDCDACTPAERQGMEDFWQLRERALLSLITDASPAPWRNSAGNLILFSRGLPQGPTSNTIDCASPASQARIRSVVATRTWPSPQRTASASQDAPADNDWMTAATRDQMIEQLSKHVCGESFQPR